MFLIPEASALTLDKDDIKLIPSGESIGIKLETGVYIDKTFGVNGKSPSEDAGIRPGDKILKFNNKIIESSSDIKEELDNITPSKTISIVIERNGKELKKEIKPIIRDGVRTLGLYLNDNIVGVGTLTYVFPEYDLFGALGHGINDTKIKVDSGYITKSIVMEIEKGSIGNPGEKKAIISDKEIGIVTKNTITGIYGVITNSHFENQKVYPIADKEEVKTGKAQILTVIKDNKVETFDVEILEVTKQNEKDIKSMKIKITDEKLLTRTGGIIQGMSGSPIIQNGKIIGAITHVLINDPTMGYGIYIEWMLEDSDIFIK
ncbi:SpoIVB peptidase [Mycoplasmatota bacterium]|nr:SpoIVB peptidase [Mycoplasmatota bacterium]